MRRSPLFDGQKGARLFAALSHDGSRKGGPHADAWQALPGLAVGGSSSLSTLPDFTAFAKPLANLSLAQTGGAGPSYTVNFQDLFGGLLGGAIIVQGNQLPTGYNQYDALGHLVRVVDSNGNPLWQAHNARDGAGNLQEGPGGGAPPTPYASGYGAGYTDPATGLQSDATNGGNGAYNPASGDDSDCGSAQAFYKDALGKGTKDLTSAPAWQKGSAERRFSSQMVQRVPVAGQAYAAYIAATGYDPIAGDCLSVGERALAGLSAVPSGLAERGLGAAGKGLGRGYRYLFARTPKRFNVLTNAKKLLDPQAAVEYERKFRAGFDYAKEENRVGGYQEYGNRYVTEGRHRFTAAARIWIKDGNRKPWDELINHGDWRTPEPDVNLKDFKYPFPLR